MTLTPELIRILSTATIRDNQFLLNCGQLDRRTYEELNKVLEAFGGKWNRKHRAHVFENDPTDAVEQAIQTGVVISAKKQFDFFQTPPHLAERMVELADVTPGLRVLEPSAGRGRILDALPRGIELETVELNPDNRRVLIQRGTAPVHDDFMTFEPCSPYDAVVANPPFSEQQDIKHINRMFDMLKPGGRLVSVASQSILYRSNRLTVEFRQRLEGLGGRIELLPDNTFIDEGTQVRTCLVILA